MIQDFTTGQSLEVTELRARNVMVTLKNGARLHGTVTTARYGRGGNAEIEVKKTDGKASGRIDLADVDTVTAV